MATRIPALIQLSDPRVAAQLVLIMVGLQDTERGFFRALSPYLFNMYNENIKSVLGQTTGKGA